LRDRELARHLAQHGRRTVLERHTCGHRVDELLAVAAELGVETTQVADTAERTVS
jgi:Glycosyl transferases group 1